MLLSIIEQAVNNLLVNQVCDLDYAHFPAFHTRYILSRASQLMHVSPRLALVSCFLSLGANACICAKI